MSGPMVFTNPYVAKSPVHGRIVAVLRGVTDRRGLHILEHRSRAVRVGEIHELMITDEAAPRESIVNRVALLAFVEITAGGVLMVDDQVVVGTSVLGSLAGFDETHMPNHQNICLRGALQDGEQCQIALADVVVFSRVE